MAQGETLSASSTGSAGRPLLEQPRQRGLLARPFPDQSNIIVRQQRHRVASPAVQSVLRVLRCI
eukprot:6869975-Prymnesium_polylepis.1